LATRKTTVPTGDEKTKTPARRAGTATAAKSASASATKAAAKKTSTKAAAGPKKAPARKTPAKEVSARKSAPPPPAEKVAPTELELSGPSWEAARVAAEAALEKKATDVAILDVRGLTSYADFFVVASGGSDRQVSAIADSVEEKMKKAGNRPIGMEGYQQGHWVLIDFGDVIAHVFFEETRAFYDIEGLWADARRIPLE